MATMDPVQHSAAVAEQAIVQTPELLESMAMESGIWQSEADRQNRMDSRQNAEDFTGQAWQMLQWQVMLHADWFNRLHKNGDESADYVNANQWSVEDRQAHLDVGRKPYEMDMLTPYVNALCGEQIGQRTEWNAVPLSPTMDKQKQADVANHYLKWIAQAGSNQWKQTASMCFRDGVIRGIGVCGVRLDPHDPMEAIAIKHMRPQEFMWDISSTENGWLDGTKYLIRRYTRDRVDLAWQYREWMPDILAMSPNLSTGYGTYDFFYNMMQPKVLGATNSLQNPMQFNPTIQTVFGGRLPVCEMFERIWVQKWAIRDSIAKRLFTFDTPQDAAAARQILVNFYDQTGFFAQTGATPLSISQVMPKSVCYLQQLTWVGNVLVEVKAEETDRFPYKFFIPDWYDGAIVSFVERGKSRQRFVNRLFSLLDQAAGGMKPQAIVNHAYLSPKMTQEEVDQQFTEPGKVWHVDQASPQFDPTKVVHITPVPNIAPMIMPLYQLVTDSIKNGFGGAVQIGEADYAGQSGASQDGLRAAGATATMNIYDAFTLFTEQVGETAIELAGFLDPATRMEVVDESGQAYDASFLDYGVTSFSELRFSILVAEKSVNPSEQARRFSQFIALAGQMPENAPDFMDLILKYMDVPYNDKIQVIQRMQQRQQQQAQLAERAQQLSEQAQMTKDAVQKGNLMLKAAELDLARLNMPKIAGTFKLPASPAIMASVLQQAGIDAHPQMIAADIAQKALMDQDIRDVAQVHETELMTEDQKKMVANKVATSELHVQSQKDQVARSQKTAENV